MTTFTSSNTTADVSGLVAAISRNSEPGSLGTYIDSFRWDVIGKYMQPAQYERGHLLIGQGDHDRNLFFLESGNLKVDVKTDAGLVHLAIIGPGTVVGEGSFFSHLARNAAVAVYSDCKVWMMEPKQFAELAHEHPSVALALSQALGAVLAVRTMDLTRRIAVT